MAWAPEPGYGLGLLETLEISRCALSMGTPACRGLATSPSLPLGLLRFRDALRAAANSYNSVCFLAFTGVSGFTGGLVWTAATAKRTKSRDFWSVDTWM